ncbi:hypothetical protein JS82_06115 [Methanomassiliicoccaceae archaeon DOK]|nr:hypothetical protein JS82_06115 [Methanomassiliicoccaceae archaeon DOK]
MNSITKAIALLVVLLTATAGVAMMADSSDAAPADIQEPVPASNPEAGTAIAKVDGTPYTDFEVAVDAAISSNKTLTLLNDYQITNLNLDAESVTIDLNTKILSFERIKLINASSLTFENGTLNGLYIGAANEASIAVNTGCSVTLNDVNYYTKATGLFPSGDAASVTVKNGSVVHAVGFCIGTNAGSSSNYYVDIKISDSGIYADSDSSAAGTAVFYNVPGSLTITDSTVQGYFHGVIVRGGTAVISGSTITNTMNLSGWETYYDSEPWGTGNSIKLGALVLGNRDNASYNYPTDVTLIDTDVISDGTYGANYSAVYMWANPDPENGVNLVYDSACTFSNLNSTTNDLFFYGNNGANITAGLAVAQAGDRIYNSLQAAIDDDNEEITLVGDTKENVVVDGQTVTLDLNGKTVTNVDDHTITVKSGELTVKGKGTVQNLTHQKAALAAYPGTKVTLNGGTFDRTNETGTGPDTSGNNSWYTIKNHGDMTIDGATVRNGGGFSSCINNGWYSGSAQGTPGNNDLAVYAGTNAKLTIVSGKIDGGLNAVKNDDYGELLVQGGELTNSVQATILNWNIATIEKGTFSATSDAKAVILNGKIDGTMDKGQLTISDGTFSGPVGIQMMSGGVGIGDVTITGGTFNISSDNIIDPLTGTETNVQVSGGSFSDDSVLAYLVEGKGLVENGTMFDVVDVHTVTYTFNDTTYIEKVISGQTATQNTIPALPTLPEGCEYDFGEWDKTAPVTEDVSVSVKAEITSLTVAIGTSTVDGVTTLTATVDSTASGTPAYTWSSGEATESITPSVGGTYDVTVTLTVTSGDVTVTGKANASVTYTPSESGSTTTTTTNPDGSTTTVETDSDGSVTETTTKTETTETGNEITTVTTTGSDPSGSQTTSSTEVTIEAASGTSGSVSLPEEDVNSVIESIASAGTTTNTISVNIGENDTVTMGSAAISAIAESNAVLEISNENATVVADGDVIETLSTGDVSITVGSATHDNLNESQQQSVPENSTIVELSATVGTSPVHDLNGTVEVTMTYTLPSGIDADDVIVFYVDDDGALHQMRTVYAEGILTFYTTHFSYYFVGDRSMIPSVDPEPSPGEDDQPVVVPPVDDDDDYVPLPPIVDTDGSGSSGGDDTVKIVACAAAAVVAALMAAFLIISRRD